MIRKKASIDAQLASTKLDDEPEKQEAQQPKAKSKPKGVLFWHPRRLEGDPPKYFYRPEDSKEYSMARICTSEYPNIEFPVGSRQQLVIKGARLIDDKEVIGQLIRMAKPMTVKNLKAGSLLYDPKEVVEQGWWTKEEVEFAATTNKHPNQMSGGSGVDVKPKAPPPNIDMLSPVGCDSFARQYNVLAYDVAWTVPQKKAFLDKWVKEQW